MVLKPNSAKWRLDPRVNFAIAICGAAPGLNDPGVRVDTGEGWAALSERLGRRAVATVVEGVGECCRAQARAPHLLRPGRGWRAASGA